MQICEYISGPTHTGALYQQRNAAPAGPPRTHAIGATFPMRASSPNGSAVYTPSPRRVTEVKSEIVCEGMVRLSDWRYARARDTGDGARLKAERMQRRAPPRLVLAFKYHLIHDGCRLRPVIRSASDRLPGWFCARTWEYSFDHSVADLSAKACSCTHTPLVHSSDWSRAASVSGRLNACRLDGVVTTRPLDQVQTWSSYLHVHKRCARLTRDADVAGPKLDDSQRSDSETPRGTATATSTNTPDGPHLTRDLSKQRPDSTHFFVPATHASPHARPHYDR